jgi:hypothetical protein
MYVTNFVGNDPADLLTENQKQNTINKQII